MINLFQLIEKDFRLSWDPEELTKNFSVISNKKTNIKDITEPFWEDFEEAEIYFARNLHLFYKKELIEAAVKIHIVRKKLELVNPLSDMATDFLANNLNLANFTLIKVKANTSVKLHFDSTRKFALNVGLKNSDSCRTVIYDGNKVPKTIINENNKKYSFTMKDGEVYLVNTTQPHEVQSLFNSDKDRFLLSYSLN